LPRYDYAVRLEGPIVAIIHDAADKLWRSSCWAQFKTHWGKRSAYKTTFIHEPGTIMAAFAIRDNFRHRHAIESAYLAAIRSAQHEIIIANAYFLPSKNFCNALMAAAQRGITIKILVQGNVENFIQHFATRTLYERFLKAGIQIYEYTGGFMHAKVAVVDQIWATVGSSNIDPFSLLLAREANIFIANDQFNEALRHDINCVITAKSEFIQLSTLARQPWLLRMLPGFCYQLMRLLMGIVGYGRDDY
jgi:cardiolipin synthase